MPRVTDLVIAVDDPRAPDVTALLRRHLDFAHETTPAELVSTETPPPCARWRCFFVGFAGAAARANFSVSGFAKNASAPLVVRMSTVSN